MEKSNLTEKALKQQEKKKPFGEGCEGDLETFQTWNESTLILCRLLSK